ncbi:hypothetical protein D3C80_2087620 [compost metagenome]
MLLTRACIRIGSRIPPVITLAIPKPNASTAMTPKVMGFAYCVWTAEKTIAHRAATAIDQAMLLR